LDLFLIIIQACFNHFQTPIEISIASVFDSMKGNTKQGKDFVPMNLVFVAFNLFKALVTDGKEKEDIVY
jgi:hypothetical protein